MGVRWGLLICLIAAWATTSARAQAPDHILGGGQPDVRAQPQPQTPGAPPEPLGTGINPNQPNGPFIATDESTWLMGAGMKF
jgi:hypothetical protein